MPKKAVIVGAGLAGLTAGVLLHRKGWETRIYETRSHIGGNCFDSLQHGWFVHRYGPHIFHTSNKAVYEFLKAFTKFTSYEHRVLARTHGLPETLLPIPYNKRTEQILGRSLSNQEIVDMFFVQYSEKMWDMAWHCLPEHIRNRVPQRRDNADDRYFTDEFQGMPNNGYSGLFAQMAEEIGWDKIFINVDEDDWAYYRKPDLVVYTGSIDDYFKVSLGRLPYRSLSFEFSTRPWNERLDVAVVNECNLIYPFTRTTDYSRFYESPVNGDPLVAPMCVEYSRPWKQGRDRYYPMHWGAGEKLYQDYNRLTTIGPPVVFCGRLGSYKYMNMDETVADTMQKLSSVTSD
jgi:UDP-galactopyranose mutase